MARAGPHATELPEPHAFRRRHLPLSAVTVVRSEVNCRALVQTGEAGHICRKLAFGESETQMLSMDDLFRGRHFDREIIILCVRWYLRFKLSFRDLVEMMAERGISLAHTTIMRWIARYVPEFEKR